MKVIYSAALLLGAMTLSTIPDTSDAACRCVCVNNQITMICDNTYDAPTVCIGSYCSGSLEQEPGPLDSKSAGERFASLVKGLDQNRLIRDQ